MTSPVSGRPIPGTGAQHRHVLVAIVRDQPGVLNRVSSLLRARNFNIDSLAVSRTEQPDMSRMTVVFRSDDHGAEQVAKQLYKLIDVVRVQEVSSEPSVDCELALIKVRATTARRAEILAIAEMYQARVVDVAPTSIIIEVAGSEAGIDAIVQLFEAFGIRELARSGALVMTRGATARAPRI